MNTHYLYTLHTDDAHGWLEVPLKHALYLGIVDAISSYSYTSHDGETLYLEEDRDAGIFFKAYEALYKRSLHLKCARHDGKAFIRALNHHAGAGFHADLIEKGIL